MGVLCNILLCNSGEAYIPGQMVNGIVKYATDKPYDFVDITVSLTGKGNCSWHGRHRKRVLHYSGSEELVTEKTSILPRDSEGVPVEAPGEYQKEFHFRLPENLPSTYGDDICHIRYQVKVHFIIRQPFKPDKRYKIAIPVKAQMKVTSPQDPSSYNLGKSLFKLFSKKEQYINISTELQESIVSRGGTFNLKITVVNNSSFWTAYSKVELVQVLIYTANGGHVKRRSIVLRESSVTLPYVSKRDTVDFSTTVSTNPEWSQTLRGSRIFSIEYSLVVTMAFPPPHSDMSLSIPVVIADIVGTCDSQPLDYNDCVQNNNSTDDPPPSYLQVMAEDDARNGF